MGSAAEITEPTTGTEKLQVEDEQIVELERKTSSFPHGKRPDSADGSTITTAHSSSSSFSEVIPDYRNGGGEHVVIENLEVPESPEKVTEIKFHEEHHDGNVFFDGEEGSESADAETEAHESHTAEKKEPVVENGSASEDNKGPSREIEEVHEVDSPKEVDAVDQRAGEVIEEEVDIEGVEDYNVEKVLGNQETHDLFCPNCNSCITKRVILKKRRRKISHVPEDPKRVRRPDPVDPILRSEDNEPSAAGGDNVVHESFFYKCLSCLSIFIPKGVDSKPVPPMRNQTAGVDSKPVAPMEYPIAGVDPKPVAPMENQTAGVDSKPVASMENQIARVDSKPVAPSESVERLNTQPKPQEKATGHGNWFGSLFGFKNEEPSFHFQQGGAMPSIPEASLPRDNPSILGKETGSTANNPSKAPVPVQDGAVTSIKDASEISVSGDKKPVDTPWIQVANSNDTSKGVNNSGATTVENGKQLQVPSADEEQAQQKIDRNDASTADENQSTDKGRLSPIQPSHDMNISNIVTSGPDGVRVETIFHTEGVSHLFEGTGSSKPGFGLTNVTGLIDSGSGGPIRGIDIPPVPVSSREEGTLTEPLVRPAVARPVVEGRKVEILKSIVYGGLIEAITSLGVISSAAGSGASTLNILVLGLANLFGGLILIIHNLQELREEEPIRTTTTTEDNQTNIHEEDRYKRLLGRRENVTLHVTVAIISFIINGLLPPIVYYFSFSKTHNKDYKVASVFGASLLCIVLLAIAKAHVRSPRGSHLKSVLKYAMIAVSVSGISYVVGNFMDQLLEKYGWSDGSETPAGEMMLALMGRKAGSFGYSSSY